MMGTVHGWALLFQPQVCECTSFELLKPKPSFALGCAIALRLEAIAIRFLLLLGS